MAREGLFGNFCHFSAERCTSRVQGSSLMEQVQRGVRNEARLNSYPTLILNGVFGKIEKGQFIP